MYQPQHNDSALVVYSQDRDGPANYANGKNLSTMNLSGSPNGYDYPLVTVEFSAGKLRIISHNQHLFLCAKHSNSIHHCTNYAYTRN